MNRCSDCQHCDGTEAAPRVLRGGNFHVIAGFCTWPASWNVARPVVDWMAQGCPDFIVMSPHGDGDQG